MTYLCPNGREGITGCSGSTSSIQDVEFCIANGNAIGIQRRCDDSSSQTGTVLVGVGSKEFRNECDPYQLEVFATYTKEDTLPVSF